MHWMNLFGGPGKIIARSLLGLIAPIEWLEVRSKATRRAAMRTHTVGFAVKESARQLYRVSSRLRDSLMSVRPRRGLS